MQNTSHFFNPQKIENGQKTIEKDSDKRPFYPHKENNYKYYKHEMHFRKKDDTKITDREKEVIRKTDGVCSVIFKEFYGFLVVDSQFLDKNLKWLIISEKKSTS